MKHFITTMLAIAVSILYACTNGNATNAPEIAETKAAAGDAPEYFWLRPTVEKTNGYTHAVRIGNHLRIAGATSLDDNGGVVAPGNIEQQMKNCYKDLEKILSHFGFTFDDVIAENIYVTNMEEFFKVRGFRNSIYKKQFPTGTWLEIKGLALKDLMIEIDMQAHRSH